MLLQPTTTKKKTEEKNELVGRPLVPFFNENEQLNTTLEPRVTNHEDIQIDARVWNKDGYFEYPEEKRESGQLVLDVLQQHATATPSPSTPPPVPLLKTPQQLSKPKSKTSDKTPNKSRSKQRAGNSKKENSNSGKNTKKGTKKEAADKWAWSAFQSSPDPKCLPMPSTLQRRFSEDEDPEGIEFLLDGLISEPNSSETIEETMTMDLRKMLNLN